MIGDELRQRRVEVIREHMDTEVTQEFDLTLGTFNGHPHYEIMATGQVFDGDAEVMGYYTTTRAAFPDQRHDNARFHVAWSPRSAAASRWPWLANSEQPSPHPGATPR